MIEWAALGSIAVFLSKISKAATAAALPSLNAVKFGVREINVKIPIMTAKKIDKTSPAEYGLP